MIGAGRAWLPPAPIARQIEAKRRLNPPLIEEADTWVWGVYDEEDETGGIITRGRSAAFFVASRLIDLELPNALFFSFSEMSLPKGGSYE